MFFDTMKNSKQIFIELMVFLTFSSSLQAQYRWHIVYPNPVDTVYHAFVSLSCSGESCSALGYAYNSNRTDSNFIIHSTNGGLTWNSIKPDLPQWVYTWNSKGGLLLYDIQQIDPLEAIAVGSSGAFIRTFDGWKTWEADTFNFPPYILFHDTLAIGFDGLDFANPKEGVLFDGSDDVAFWTADSGQHWTERIHNGYIKPYGNGMWREWIPGYYFYDPDTILTTLDNWNTVDTSTFTWNGPFLKGDLMKGIFSFAGGDTLISLAARYDSTGFNQIATLVRSTDLGANWSELPVPRTNRINAAGRNCPVVGQTLVIAGEDSSEEILLSKDGGTTWELDTVLLDDGVSYSVIPLVTVTGSGRAIAAIDVNTTGQLRSVLAYLEPIPSSVTPTANPQQNLTLYPNPATNVLNLVSPSGTISISDPLGREYSVFTTPQPPPIPLRSIGGGVTVDISTLPSGVYFVSDGVNRAKFVKE